MPIVHSYNGKLNGYDGRVEVKGIWTLPRDCQYCVGRLIRWASYWRSALADGGAFGNRIRVMRMRCKVCKKTMAVLPQFVAPYQRVLTVVREEIVQSWAMGRVCGVWLIVQASA